MIEFLGGKVTPDSGKICFKSKKINEVFKFSPNRCKFHVFNDLPANSMLSKFCILFTLFLLLFACNQPQHDAPLTPMCIDGQSHCVISLKGIEVTVKFNRDRLVAEQSFKVTVEISAPNRIDSISAYMEGEDMYMGKIPLLFEKTAINQFSADGLFGSCGQAKMTWRVWLFIDSKKKLPISITVPSYLR